MLGHPHQRPGRRRRRPSPPAGPAAPGRGGGRQPGLVRHQGPDQERPAARRPDRLERPSATRAGRAPALSPPSPTSPPWNRPGKWWSRPWRKKRSCCRKSTTGSKTTCKSSWASSTSRPTRLPTAGERDRFTRLETRIRSMALHPPAALQARRAGGHRHAGIRPDPDPRGSFPSFATPWPACVWSTTPTPSTCISTRPCPAACC